MQGIYSIFEDPNMKGDLTCMVNMFPLSVNTLLNFIFFPKPKFFNLFEISMTKIIQN
jgi:hypothetical protein